MANRSMRMLGRVVGPLALLACLFVGSAQALVVSYDATLDGLAEIPPNASPSTGDALVTVDLDTLMMDVQITFAGLVGTTTASHIHCCTSVPGSANVGVATILPTFTGFPLGVTSGTYDHTFDMSLASSYNPAFVTAQGSISTAFTALIAGMETGNAYLNIHTSEFPGGEIRGLLQPVAPPDVPEPATLALVGIGLAGIGFLRRKH
jgi:hypothetical protein